MIQLKVYITARVMNYPGEDETWGDPWWKFHGVNDKMRYEVSLFKPDEDSEDILVTEYVMDIPDADMEDITLKQIDALNAKVDKSDIAHNNEVAYLKGKINDLLALPAPE